MVGIAEQIVKSFLSKIPDLKESLVISVDDWLQDDGTMSASLLCVNLARGVKTFFESEETSVEEFEDIFNVVEHLLVASDSKEIKDAVATCFLESLLNEPPENISCNWTQYLGDKSRDFCRAMDDFHGVRTAGLYED
jgi:hypothetical protein